MDNSTSYNQYKPKDFLELVQKNRYMYDSIIQKENPKIKEKIKEILDSKYNESKEREKKEKQYIDGTIDISELNKGDSTESINTKRRIDKMKSKLLFDEEVIVVIDNKEYILDKSTSNLYEIKDKHKDAYVGKLMEDNTINNKVNENDVSTYTNFNMKNLVFMTSYEKKMLIYIIDYFFNYKYNGLRNIILNSIYDKNFVKNVKKTNKTINYAISLDIEVDLCKLFIQFHLLTKYKKLIDVCESVLIQKNNNPKKQLTTTQQNLIKMFGKLFHLDIFFSTNDPSANTSKLRNKTSIEARNFLILEIKNLKKDLCKKLAENRSELKSSIKYIQRVMVILVLKNNLINNEENKLSQLILDNQEYIYNIFILQDFSIIKDKLNDITKICESQNAEYSFLNMFLHTYKDLEATKINDMITCNIKKIKNNMVSKVCKDLEEKGVPKANIPTNAESTNPIGIAKFIDDIIKLSTNVSNFAIDTIVKFIPKNEAIVEEIKTKCSSELSEIQHTQDISENLTQIFNRNDITNELKYNDYVSKYDKYLDQQNIIKKMKKQRPNVFNNNKPIDLDLVINSYSQTNVTDFNNTFLHLQTITMKDLNESFNDFNMYTIVDFVYDLISYGLIPGFIDISKTNSVDVNSDLCNITNNLMNKIIIDCNLNKHHIGSNYVENGIYKESTFKTFILFMHNKLNNSKYGQNDIKKILENEYKNNICIQTEEYISISEFYNVFKSLKHTGKNTPNNKFISFLEFEKTRMELAEKYDIANFNREFLNELKTALDIDSAKIEKLLPGKLLPGKLPHNFNVLMYYLYDELKNEEFVKSQITFSIKYPGPQEALLQSLKQISYPLASIDTITHHDIAFHIEIGDNAYELLPLIKQKFPDVRILTKSNQNFFIRLSDVEYQDKVKKIRSLYDVSSIKKIEDASVSLQLNLTLQELELLKSNPKLKDKIKHLMEKEFKEKASFVILLDDVSKKAFEQSFPEIKLNEFFKTNLKSHFLIRINENEKSKIEKIQSFNSLKPTKIQYANFLIDLYNANKIKNQFGDSVKLKMMANFISNITPSLDGSSSTSGGGKMESRSKMESMAKMESNSKMDSMAKMESNVYVLNMINKSNGYGVLKEQSLKLKDLFSNLGFKVKYLDILMNKKKNVSLKSKKNNQSGGALSKKKYLLTFDISGSLLEDTKEIYNKLTNKGIDGLKIAKNNIKIIPPTQQFKNQYKTDYSVNNSIFASKQETKEAMIEIENKEINEKQKEMVKLAFASSPGSTSVNLLTTSNLDSDLQTNLMDLLGELSGESSSSKIGGYLYQKGGVIDKDKFGTKQKAKAYLIKVSLFLKESLASTSTNDEYSSFYTLLKQTAEGNIDDNIKGFIIKYAFKIKTTSLPLDNDIIAVSKLIFNILKPLQDKVKERLGNNNSLEIKRNVGVQTNNLHGAIQNVDSVPVTSLPVTSLPGEVVNKPDIVAGNNNPEQRAKEEAKRKAREEAERKANEEAERKAREEAERKTELIKEINSLIKQEYENYFSDFSDLNDLESLDISDLEKMKKKIIEDVITPIKSKVEEYTKSLNLIKTNGIIGKFFQPDGELITKGTIKSNSMVNPTINQSVISEINKFKRYLDNPYIKDASDPQGIFQMVDTFIKGITDLGKGNDLELKGTIADIQKKYDYELINDLKNNLKNNLTVEKLNTLSNDLDYSIKPEIEKLIRDATEKLLGACRVILKYRDAYTSHSVLRDILKIKGDNLIKKHSILDKYCFIKDKCVGKLKEGTETLHGPFSFVYDESNDTEDIFSQSFVADGLMESAKAGSSLVIFGFGFSGSGKTFQLISPDNKKKIGSEVREVHLLAQCLNHIIEEPSEFGEVNKISLKVSELYPFVDGSIKNKESIKGHDGSGNTYLEGDDKSYEGITYPTWDRDATKFLTEFNEFNEKVTRKRTNLMRITPTPNNPESSRSHIFYDFEINYVGGDKAGKGHIVIVDMAGTENTIEIKKNFLNITPEDKDKTEKFENKNELNIERTHINTGINILQYGNCEEVKKKKETRIINKVANSCCQIGQLDFIYFTDGSYLSNDNISLLKKIFDIDNKDYLHYIIRGGDATYLLDNKSNRDNYSIFNLTYSRVEYKTHTRKKIDTEKKGFNINGDWIPILSSVLFNKLFAVMTRLLYNMNPEDSLEGKYIISFDTKDDKKPNTKKKNNANEFLFEKVTYFYNKLKENCISDSKNTDNNTYMGQNVKSIGNDVFTTIKETFDNLFLKTNDNTKIDSLLHWLNFENEFNTKENIIDIINNGYYIEFDKDVKSEDILNIETIPETISFLKQEKTKKINYNNPIQIYLVLLIKYFFLKKIDGISKVVNKHIKFNYKSEKLKKAYNIGLKILLYLFLNRYLEIVVNQGKGIVATLEHLKFFFLNKSAPNTDGIPIPSALKKYDDLNEDRKLGTLEKVKNPVTGTLNYPHPVTGTWDYTHEDKIGEIIMKETRQRGFMQQFKTIEILSKLAGVPLGKQIFCDRDITNSCVAYPGTTPAPPRLNNTGSEKSKFVMLAAILRTKINDSKYNTDEEAKLCKASLDTLQLASNLASEPKPTQGQFSSIKSCDSDAVKKKEKCFTPTTVITNLNNDNMVGGGSKQKRTKKIRKYKFILNSTKKRKPKKRTSKK
jgi:hypothetical protein